MGTYGTVWALIEPYGHLWECRTKHRMGQYDRMGTLTLTQILTLTQTLTLTLTQTQTLTHTVS